MVEKAMGGGRCKPVKLFLLRMVKGQVGRWAGGSVRRTGGQVGGEVGLMGMRDEGKEVDGWAGRWG